MTTLRKCPVCRSTVSSSGSTHCPECGAVLDLIGSSDAESIAVDDIIKKVRQQAVSSNGAADKQSPAAGDGEARNIAEILSEAAFQSILNANRDSDESSPGEDRGSAPEVPAWQHGDVGSAYQKQPDTGTGDDREDRSAPFSAVLESFKQEDSRTGVQDARDDASENSPGTDRVFDSGKEEKNLPEAEPVYTGRPEPEKKTDAPKKRTWWRVARQTLWLLLVLLTCIIFFRIFGPERKKTTVEDFFRPGNPDVEFLEAIEFLEEYYEKQRKQNSGLAEFDSAETDAEITPQPLSPGAIAENPPVQSPDSTTTPARGAFSPESRGSTP